MRTADLFESKRPEWVLSERAAFSNLVKRYGFKMSKTLPYLDKQKDKWIFGGQIEDIYTPFTEPLSRDKRIMALQRAVAQHLFQKKEAGFKVFTLDYLSLNMYTVRSDTREFLDDDTLGYFQHRLKEKLVVKHFPSGDYLIEFEYGLGQPEPEAAPPAPPPSARPLRVVKGPR